MLQEDPFEFDDDDVELDDAALAQIDALSSLNAMSAPLLPFGVFRETQLPPSANGGFCRQNQPSPSVGVVRDSFSQSQLAAASTQVHAQFQRPQTFVGSLLPALTSSTRQSQDLGEGGLSLAYKKQLDELAAENMRLKKEFDEKVGETFALRMRVDEKDKEIRSLKTAQATHSASLQQEKEALIRQKEREKEKLQDKLFFTEQELTKAEQGRRTALKTVEKLEAEVAGTVGSGIGPNNHVASKTNNLVVESSQRVMAGANRLGFGLASNRSGVKKVAPASLHGIIKTQMPTPLKEEIKVDRGEAMDEDGNGTKLEGKSGTSTIDHTVKRKSPMLEPATTMNISRKDSRHIMITKILRLFLINRAASVPDSTLSKLGREYEIFLQYLHFLSASPHTPLPSVYPLIDVLLHRSLHDESHLELAERLMKVLEILSADISCCRAMIEELSDSRGFLFRSHVRHILDTLFSPDEERREPYQNLGAASFRYLASAAFVLPLEFLDAFRDLMDATRYTALFRTKNMNTGVLVGIARFLARAVTNKHCFSALFIESANGIFFDRVCKLLQEIMALERMSAAKRAFVRLLETVCFKHLLELSKLTPGFPQAVQRFLSFAFHEANEYITDSKGSVEEVNRIFRIISVFMHALEPRSPDTSAEHQMVSILERTRHVKELHIVSEELLEFYTLGVGLEL